MDCINEGLIQMYIDGEASKEEVIEIKKHLTVCKACSSKVWEQKKLAGELKQAINLLDVEESGNNRINLPQIKNGTQFCFKRIAYIASAASVLLISIAIFKGREPVLKPTQSINYELEWEVDANRPITDQDFTISIVDVDGKVSELLIN